MNDLPERLREEARLALVRYLKGLLKTGRTDDPEYFESMEQMRLQYLRLEEAARWAEE